MCYSSSSPRPVNSASNSQSDTTGRRSAVDQEDLKKHTGNQKNGHISLGDQQSYYLQVFVIIRLY